MIEEDKPIIEQRDSVKLIKNSKGYNWEIKLIDIDLDRLEEINDELIRRFQNE